MAVSTWPDISHLFVSRPELINVLRQMGQQVKWPQKMKTRYMVHAPLTLQLTSAHDSLTLYINVHKLLQLRSPLFLLSRRPIFALLHFRLIRNKYGRWNDLILSIESPSKPGLIHKRPQAATAQVASLLAEPAPYLCTSSLWVDPGTSTVDGTDHLSVPRPIFAPSPNYLQMVSKSLLDLTLSLHQLHSVLDSSEALL
ncbi:hypothetical protein F2Q69_00006456 [Brassica cretica]|uniref:Uncharacterized protein n=1 Tax=Brassica cretica TaxID=69181 RepID=A0A8S9PB84_BRACR|nr:hypothetical protein F2Q69_00006456 [Brassica cretica]